LEDGEVYTGGALSSINYSNSKQNIIMAIHNAKKQIHLEQDTDPHTS
jgi:hypothetical protein